MLACGLVLALLAGLPADAPTSLEPAPAAAPAPTVPSAAALAQARPSTGRLVLAVGAATLAILATSVASGFAGALIPRLCLAAAGRPDPLCSTAGFALGGAVQVGLAALLVPEVFRLGNDADGHGDPGATRLGLWRVSRWAALVAALGTLVYGVGAILEHGSYGAGQALLIGGGATVLAAWLVFDVAALWGATVGYRQSYARW